jgi:hypothetical protein
MIGIAGDDRIWLAASQTPQKQACVSEQLFKLANTP